MYLVAAAYKKKLYMGNMQFLKPRRLSGAEILNLVADIETKFGKKFQKKVNAW